LYSICAGAFLALVLAADAVFKNNCPAGRNSVFNECLCKMDHCLDSLTFRCQHKLAQKHVPAAHHHSSQQVWAYQLSQYKPLQKRI